MNRRLNFQLHLTQTRINLRKQVFIFVLNIIFCINVVAQPIIGGNPIDIQVAPYQVSLEYGTNGSLGHQCGGAIINSEWVLTAAHCAMTFLGEPKIVHAGATDQTNNSIGQRVEIDQIIRHPDYMGNVLFGNDLALLHLKTPLCFNQNVQPIPFATPENTTEEDIAPGKIAFITGWGDTGNGVSTILMGASLPVISDEVAHLLLNEEGNNCPPGDFDTNSIIALYEPGVAAGGGDSGGPAVIT